MRTRGEESGSPDAIPVLASDLITSQASWCGWEEEVEPFAARSATIMKPELAVVSDCSIDRTTTDSPNRLDRPLRKPRRSPRPGFPFRWTGFLPQRARSKTPSGNPTRWSPSAGRAVLPGICHDHPILMRFGRRFVAPLREMELLSARHFSLSL